MDTNKDIAIIIFGKPIDAVKKLDYTIFQKLPDSIDWDNLQKIPFYFTNDINTNKEFDTPIYCIRRLRLGDIHFVFFIKYIYVGFEEMQLSGRICYAGAAIGFNEITCKPDISYWVKKLHEIAEISAKKAKNELSIPISQIYINDLKANTDKIRKNTQSLSFSETQPHIISSLVQGEAQAIEFFSLSLDSEYKYECLYAATTQRFFDNIEKDYTLQIPKIKNLDYTFVSPPAQDSPLDYVKESNQKQTVGNEKTHTTKIEDMGKQNIEAIVEQLVIQNELIKENEGNQKQRQQELKKMINDKFNILSNQIQMVLTGNSDTSYHRSDFHNKTENKDKNPNNADLSQDEEHNKIPKKSLIRWLVNNGIYIFTLAVATVVIIIMIRITKDYIGYPSTNTDTKKFTQEEVDEFIKKNTDSLKAKYENITANLTDEKEKLKTKISELENLRKPTPQNNNRMPIYHKFEVGETLFSIAKKYDISVDSIRLLNKEDVNGDIIKPNATLWIRTIIKK